MILSRTISEIIAFALIALIAMDVHEFAHAYIANLMGDTTARDMGKMTLDPRVNINWVGWLMWAFLGFGILGSVPVNARRMRDPRWGELAAVAAGPFSNLLLAAVFAIFIRIGIAQPDLSFSRQQIFPTLDQIVTIGVFLNLLMFLFNLLPFYPFDGWTIMLRLVPSDLSYTLQCHQQTSTLIFFACLALSILGVFDIFGRVLYPPLGLLFQLLTGYRLF